jgi:drug/metabolite transporter (DMT)-like permease
LGLAIVQAMTDTHLAVLGASEQASDEIDDGVSRLLRRWRPRAADRDTADEYLLNDIGVCAASDEEERVMNRDASTMAVPASRVAGTTRAPQAALYARLALTALFWGGTFIAGRFLALEMPHFVAATARYVVATAALIAYLWIREGGLPRPTRLQWLGIGVLGATGVFAYNAFFFAALAELPAGRAALIIATNPALTAIGAWLVFRLRFAWWQWLGVAIAFAGVTIVVSRGDFTALGAATFGKGETLMFCGALSWAVYALVGRSMMQRHNALSPLATTAYASAVGLLMLAAVATFELPQVEWSRFGLTELAAVGYLGLFGTAVGFVWFYEGVKALGAARASVFTNLVPVFGVALAVLVLDEPLLASMIVGGLVTLASA